MRTRTGRPARCGLSPKKGLSVECLLSVLTAAVYQPPPPPVKPWVLLARIRPFSRQGHREGLALLQNFCWPFRRTTADRSDTRTKVTNFRRHAV